MRIDHESSHHDRPNDHDFNDHSEFHRRLSVAETRAESLERECATLQQSLAEVQNELERSKRTEQSCRELIEEKNRWLVRLAHDLRGPLGGIGGMAELMLKSPVTTLQKSQLEVVSATADEMLDLVADLMELSRGGAGPHDREDVEFDLDRMLSDAVNNSALAAEKKGLDLYYYCSADLPQFMVGDPIRLRRVVANLVNNAIKFTERGEVMVRALRVNDEAGASQLQIVVEDTGSGIRTDKQRKVFDAFWRDESAAGTDGTGLGLSICDELVIQMGGRIRVESQPGRGSRFYVSLPLASPAGQRLCDRPLFGCRYMLVAEPSRRRSVYRKMLERAGAEIITCRATTLQRLLSHGDIHTLSCDGVVMDCVRDAELEMALTNQIFRVTGLKRLVLLVPRSATSVWTRCEEFAGASPIAKPVDYGQLIQSLQHTVTVAHSDVVMPKTDPLRILLADDCEVNQMVAAGLLGMYGHRVDTVTNGQLAVDAVATQTYDLVLMDLEMPGLDGMRAARMMRENTTQTSTRLPIVGMTAHVDSSLRNRCKANGMDACLAKPLDPHTLLSTIVELSRRESIEASADPLNLDRQSPRDPMASKKADPPHDGLSPNVTSVPLRIGPRSKSHR